MKTVVALFLLSMSFTAWSDNQSTDPFQAPLFDDYILSLQPEDTLFTDDEVFINAMFIAVTIPDGYEKDYWTTGASKKLSCKESQFFEVVLQSILDNETKDDLVPIFLIRGYGETLMRCAITTRSHILARSKYFSELYDNCLRTYMSDPKCDQMIDIDAKIHRLNEKDILQADALERHAKKFLQ